MQKVTLHISATGNWLTRLAIWLRGQRKEVHLPASWKEVRADDVLPIMKILMKKQDDKEACLKILKHYLPLPGRLFYYIAGIDFVEKLIPMVRWMTTAPILRPVLYSIHHRGEYIMPADYFENVRLDEYIAADEAYERIVGGDALALTHLVAILLREREHDRQQVINRNDERVPLDTYRLRDRIAGFADLPEEVKFYVAYFYSCNKQYLFERYRDAFDSKAQAERNNWEDVLTDLAEAGPFGTMEQVRQITVHTFFQWLLKNKRRHNEKEQERLQDIIKSNHKRFLA